MFPDVPGWLYLLGASLALGMLHGVIPDEHTWPITFSYSVGSATGRGGMLSGAYFAAAFTVQRAIMSQLVYFALVTFLAFNEGLNGPVYIAVGLAMSAAGYLILRNKLPHWHPLMWISTKDRERHVKSTATGLEPSRPGEVKTVPIHWCLIHGFISGFGVDTGLFTTFVYLVAVPAMPSSALGFAPGAAFGLGTLLILLFIGFTFGEILQVTKRWGVERMQVFGVRVGARSLLLGGIAFIIAGILFQLGLEKALPVELGELIILAFLVAIIIPVMITTWREVRTMPMVDPKNEKSPTPP